MTSVAKRSRIAELDLVDLDRAVRKAWIVKLGKDAKQVVHLVLGAVEDDQLIALIA